ncbi:MAG: hypothetical protein WCL32_20940, partial [Planctomycetota bacterium]
MRIGYIDIEETLTLAKDIASQFGFQTSIRGIDSSTSIPIKTKVWLLGMEENARFEIFCGDLIGNLEVQLDAPIAEIFENRRLNIISLEFEALFLGSVVEDSGVELLVRRGNQLVAVRQDRRFDEVTLAKVARSILVVSSDDAMI